MRLQSLGWSWKRIGRHVGLPWKMVYAIWERTLRERDAEAAVQGYAMCSIADNVDVVDAEAGARAMGDEAAGGDPPERYPAP